MAKVLVTGGAGFIGSRLVDSLGTANLLEIGIENQERIKKLIAVPR